MVYNHKGIDVFYKDFGEAMFLFFCMATWKNILFGKSFVKIASYNRCVVIDLFGHGKPNLMPISILWKKWHLWLQILLIT